MFDALWLVGSLAIGFLFLYLVMRLVVGSAAQSSADDLESRYGTQQVARSKQKQSILWQIGGPECPDGTYSPRQNYLWDEYNRLDAIDQDMTEQERREIVKARMRE